MTVYSTEGPLRVRTNLADSNLTERLKSGEIRSPLVDFVFDGPKVAHDGFKPMVREGAFDAGELAIATYLQARVYDKPYVMLPAVVVGRFQHHCLAYNTNRGKLAPKDLEGRTLGVRSYSQTTGMWVRGLLKHEYGVDIDKINWLVADEGHLAEYSDPENVTRLEKGHKKIAQMLLDGDIDGALLGNEMPKGDERIETVIPDPHSAAKVWFAKHKIVPVNHVFVVRKELSQERPDVVREIYRMLKEAKDSLGLAPGEIDTLPFGFDNLRGSLEAAVEYAAEQNIIPRRLTVDELFDATTRSLQA